MGSGKLRRSFALPSLYLRSEGGAWDMLKRSLGEPSAKVGRRLPKGGAKRGRTRRPEWGCEARARKAGKRWAQKGKAKNAGGVAGDKGRSGGEQRVRIENVAG